MKKLLLIFSLLFAAKSFAQYPLVQGLGNDSTLIKVGQNYKGGIKGGLINMSVADTTAANLLRIKVYPGAMIFTTSDGLAWVRNPTATGWILLGGGTTPSGAFWLVGGQEFPITLPSRNLGTGSFYGGAVGLMTSGVVRAIVPNGGFVLDNDTASNKIFTWNPTSKELGYANWNNGGSGGSSSLSLNSKKALYFPGGTTESHVLHGYYFVENFQFGNGLFEAWIRPQGGQYVISDGYGGVHDWLFGVELVNDSMFTLSGNVWDGSNNTALQGKDLIKINTAHHIACGLSDGYLITYIDGVPSWKTAWAYGRRNAAASGCGQLFIGGSDHQNFKGTIFRTRMWEDVNPYSMNGPNYVQQIFRADDPYISFMADYTNWQNTTFEDFSPGIFGSRHPGSVHYSQAVSSPVPIVSTDSLPHFINDSIYKSPYVGATTAAPVGCKIFDAFERTDEVPAFDLPNIDSTQGGTLGRLKYTYGNGGWTSGVYAGIINTYAYFSYAGGGNNFVTVTGDSPDQDVRVTTVTTTSEQQWIVIARYTDDNNQIYARAENGSINLYKIVSGSFSSLGSYSGSVFSELKLVVSGSNATVYADGVSRIAVSTVGDVPSGNKSGFGSANSFTRIKKFEVY